jgi:hypothetical protein
MALFASMWIYAISMWNYYILIISRLNQNKHSKPNFYVKFLAFYVELKLH